MQDKPNEANKPTPEQVDSVLRKAVKEKSSWTVGHVLVTILLLIPPLACLGWMVWPTPDPPDAYVVAFDALSVAKKNPKIGAVLRSKNLNTKHETLAGWPVVFQVGRTSKTSSGQLTKAQSNELGWVSAMFKKPLPEGIAPVMVSYRPEYSEFQSESLARIFTWPPNSPILIVDAENTLTKKDKVDWHKVGIDKISPNPEAAKAMLAMQKANFKIVYLACTVTDPLDYLKVREWVNERSRTIEPVLPDGPVLGRESYDPELSTHLAVKGRVESIAKQFSGRVIVVTTHEETSNAMTESGAETINVGHPHDDRTTTVKDWDAFVKKYGE